MVPDRRANRRCVIWVTAAAVVLIAASAFAYWRFFCCYGIVNRAPKKVADLPPYGDEIKRQELNPPAPAAPTPTYTGQGGYLRWAPDKSRAAVTTNVAGYYRTISVWDEHARRLTPVISIEDADPGSGRAYRYTWSEDSKALLIYGHGSLPWGENGAAVWVSKICFVYLPHEDQLYFIDPCKGTKWAYG